MAGSDIIGEELNDIRDIAPVIHEIVRIAAADPGFVVRIHAGENDSMRDDVINSVRCVRESLRPGQVMPRIRICLISKNRFRENAPVLKFILIPLDRAFSR